MFYKIYFNNKPLYLCDEVSDELQPIIHHDDGVFIDELSGPAVKSMLHEMALEKVHAGVFYHPDLAALQKAVWKKFTVIQAGGGVVRNAAGQFLFIFRRGKWDLPKGKLDEGETIEQCALREVAEECGIGGLVPGPLLTITYHTYNDAGKPILKETYWYTMDYRGDAAPVPQTEEDISEIRWVAPEQLHEVLGNTYPSVQEVIALLLPPTGVGR
jgi:8-oxo-dGTP pyrophosphatase MutT (NUDIX family)